MRAFSNLFVLHLYLLAFISLSFHENGGEGAVRLISNDFNQLDFDNDFENGKIDPWLDQSEGETHWVVEKYSIDLFSNGIMPPPSPNGNNFLIMKHDLEIFSLGLLSTTTLVALPGDIIMFSYWISSHYSGFHNIQLFWSANNKHDDDRLLELFPYSSANNYEWRSITVYIPVFIPTKGRVLIYGFCGPNNNNSGLIAIDDIKIIQKQSSDSTIINYLSSIPSNSPIATDQTEIDYAKSESSASLTTILDPIYTSLMSIQEASTTILTTIDGISTSLTQTTLTNNKCNGGQLPLDMDFSPCTACILESGGLEVRCEQVNMTEARDGPFQRLDNLDITSLYLSPIEGDIIPSTFFGTAVSRVQNIIIDCFNHTSPLVLDDSAFESNTSIEFESFSSFSCDLLNLHFLSPINYLRELKFDNSSNLDEVLSTLPKGFEMDVLGIIHCRNLDNIDDEGKLPSLSFGIKELLLNENENLQDKTVDLFLSWISSTSKDSLEKLEIFSNGLTKIPSNLSRFNILIRFRFDNNIIQSGNLETGSINFPIYSYSINLTDCGIHTIEPGAFKGEFYSCALSLMNNSLTRFESSVFLLLLNEMIQGNGKLSILGNPIDCVSDPCHLSWIIRDRRPLLYKVNDGYCADGRKFSSIPSSDEMFNGCP